jgi:hypothetical protein
MSLRPQPLEPVPEETARVARAAFPKGNPLSNPARPAGDPLPGRGLRGPVWPNDRVAAVKCNLQRSLSQPLSIERFPIRLALHYRDPHPEPAKETLPKMMVRAH